MLPQILHIPYYNNPPPKLLLSCGCPDLLLLPGRRTIGKMTIQQREHNYGELTSSLLVSVLSRSAVKVQRLSFSVSCTDTSQENSTNKNVKISEYINKPYQHSTILKSSKEEFSLPCGSTPCGSP